jgi:formylglycine-generating enzyme required for sulfatase activity
MKPMRAVVAFGLALGMMAAGTTSARATITIATVNVGNPGNPNDSTGYGGVSYIYAIGTYEVNLTQYTAFLNAVAATDTYSLYNTSMATQPSIAGISRAGSSGSYTYSVIGSGSRPVTFVSWFDAARFSNWMANGQPTGAQGNATTENGAYTLNGAMSGVGFTKNTTNPNTAATPTWWIPSENEWYKAAYYQPAAQGGDSDGYWYFPTRSNSWPENNIGAGANQANYYAGDYAVTQSSSFSGSQDYLTDGGAFSASESFYGTFDQGGNVYEWNEAVIGSSRGLRGGSWGSNGGLLSSGGSGEGPSFEDSNIGFRVASVPEPSTSMLMLMGGGAWLLRKRRRVTL